MALKTTHFVAVDSNEFVHAANAAAAQLGQQNHPFNVVVPEVERNTRSEKQNI
jgi:hypothetical protein